MIILRHALMEFPAAAKIALTEQIHRKSVVLCRKPRLVQPVDQSFCIYTKRFIKFIKFILASRDFPSSRTLAVKEMKNESKIKKGGAGKAVGGKKSMTTYMYNK